MAQFNPFENNGYTKKQMNEILSQKADLDEDGLIPISELPQIAFSECITVQNQAERFALTPNDVQKGDTVYQNDVQIMYFVIDITNLDNEAGYKPFAAGIAAQAIADKDGNEITATYQKKIAFEGTYDSSSNKAATMADIKDGKLTGYAQGSGNVTATDKVIEAIGKVEKKADDNTSGLSSKQNQVLGSWTAGTATTHQTPTGTDTVLQALQKIDNNQRNDEANVSSIQSKTNRIIMDSTEDTLLYVQATQPTGNITEGSIWINTAVSGS